MSAVAPPSGRRPTRPQLAIGSSALLCYAVGYPLALLTGSVGAAIGWTLVTLGGVFLLGLGVVTIQRVHHDSSDPGSEDVAG
jgi:hypothetical protein